MLFNTSQERAEIDIRIAHTHAVEIDYTYAARLDQNLVEREIAMNEAPDPFSRAGHGESQVVYKSLKPSPRRRVHHCQTMSYPL